MSRCDGSSSLPGSTTPRARRIAAPGGPTCQLRVPGIDTHEAAIGGAGIDPASIDDGLGSHWSADGKASCNAPAPRVDDKQIARALRPGGRLQIADICVDRPVSDSAKRDIDLWTG